MTDKLQQQIDRFLSANRYAVVGASEDSRKYGHKVFKCYLQHQREAYPINPSIDTVLGHQTYPTIASVPLKTDSVSIITPPAVTEKVVEDAIASGVSNIWMQPGAESRKAIEAAQNAGINVIYGGPCLLVVMGYHESY